MPEENRDRDLIENIEENIEKLHAVRLLLTLFHLFSFWI